MTGFAKRGFPQTSNSMNLEDHNLVFKKDTNLKMFHLRWCSLLTAITFSNLKLWNVKVGKFIANPVTYSSRVFSLLNVHPIRVNACCFEQLSRCLQKDGL